MVTNPIRFAQTSKSTLPIAEATAIVALGISTILSGSGVFFSLDVFSLNLVVRAILAGAITFLITASIYIAVRRAGFAFASRKFEGILHNRRSGYVLLSLLFGVAMVCISSATSFSAMAYLRYESVIQASIDTRANQAVVKPLRDMAIKFGDVAVEAENVSSVAASRSDRFFYKK